jgi:hypothetical protein
MNRILPSATFIAALLAFVFAAFVWVAVFAVVWPDLAYSAEAMAEAPWSGLSAIVMPHVMQGIGMIVSAVFLYLANLARLYLGIAISEKDVARVHSAAMTEVTAAIQRNSSDPIGDAVRYMRGEGSGKSVRRLKASDAALTEIARAKLATQTQSGSERPDAYSRL